jgi:peroxiredoxin
LWSRVAGDQAATPPAAGDRAPRFSYLGPDGAWHDFSDLFAKGPVMLVFGASDSDLETLDHAQQAFHQLGVNTAVVVDMRAGSAARLARRLRLSSPLMCDPVRAIAGLYGSLDPASLRHAPAVFLVDANGTILIASRGALPPLSQMLEASARALGRPVSQARLPSSS